MITLTRTSAPAGTRVTGPVAPLPVNPALFLLGALRAAAAVGTVHATLAMRAPGATDPIGLTPRILLG